MTYFYKLAVITLSLWALALPAAAQEAATAPVTNWPVSCVAEARSAPMTCTATAAAFVKDTGQKVLEARLRGTPGQPLALYVVGPFGISTQKPFTIKVGEDLLASAPIYTCEKDGCYARFEMNDALIQKISAAPALDVSFARLDDSIVNVPLPLSGFAQANAAVK